jgi:hypothetical protein
VDHLSRNGQLRMTRHGLGDYSLSTPGCARTGA